MKPTWSQEQGIDPLPQLASLGELPKRARNRLWGVIYNVYGESKAAAYPHECDLDYIVYEWHTMHLSLPPDEFVPSWHGVMSFKPLFMEGEYNRVFDFLQFVLRHRLCPSVLWRALASVLEDCMCAYTVVEDGPTIVPIAQPEQRESAKKSFRVLTSGTLRGSAVSPSLIGRLHQWWRSSRKCS